MHKRVRQVDIHLATTNCASSRSRLPKKLVVRATTTTASQIITADVSMRACNVFMYPKLAVLPLEVAGHGAALDGCAGRVVRHHPRGFPAMNISGRLLLRPSNVERATPPSGEEGQQRSSVAGGGDQSAVEGPRSRHKRETMTGGMAAAQTYTARGRNESKAPQRWPPPVGRAYHSSPSHPPEGGNPSRRDTVARSDPHVMCSHRVTVMLASIRKEHER